jgi:hypothetical protein
VSVAAASVDVVAALPELRHVEHEQNEGGGVDSFRSTLPEQNEGSDGFMGRNFGLRILHFFD